MTRWFSPPIPRKTAETASVAFTEIPQRELRVGIDRRLLVIMPESCIHRNPTKGIERVERIRQKGEFAYTLHSPKSHKGNWESTTRCPKVRYPQKLLHSPKSHKGNWESIFYNSATLTVTCIHHLSCIHRNPTKGIESSLAWRAGPPRRLWLLCCIHRNPTKGIESLRQRRRTCLGSVAFTEIPQRELRDMSQK